MAWVVRRSGTGLEEVLRYLPWEEFNLNMISILLFCCVMPLIDL